ncbi:MAG: AAA domain-containing protein [Kiritimatiellia bacterium]
MVQKINDLHVVISQTRAEELTAALRAIEVQLDALTTKILCEAKVVVATSLTKMTTAKQLEDQEFDVVLVDEASMTPMPSLYFGAGHATQKAILVGDFPQLPPIVLAEWQMAQNGSAATCFSQAGTQCCPDQISVGALLAVRTNVGTPLSHPKARD